MSLRSFNAIAAARGDGLDPRLRELLEREGVPFNGERVVMRVARIPELAL